jgi:shikimate dehydrogenase
MVRASAFALTTRGVELIIGESVVERARELSAAVGGTCVLWKDLNSSLEAIAVVSATSKSHATSLEAARLPAGCLVFETSYGPEESPLLREAREAGHRTIDGLDLLVRRTAVQFALFTGAHAPFERMRRIAQIERIRGMEHSTER